MNKWAATSLVLLIAILCGTIHGAVLREQQQPLDAVHQQVPDHINGTEKTDTDNAKSEKPGPNPKTSEPEKSELYPAEFESKASGEQARKKRQKPPPQTQPPPPPPKKESNSTTTSTTSKPPRPVVVNSTDSSATRMPPPSNATNGNETGLYEPKDNPDIKRNYTANLIYWNDETQRCYRKANASETEDTPIGDKEIVVIDLAKMTDATAKKEMPLGNDTLFNDWSYCAKIQFYGNLGLDEAKKYYGKDKVLKKEFSDLRDFETGGFMQDMVLLLIDGRIECKSAAEDMEVQLSIVQELEAGKIPELCAAESRSYGNTTVTLEKGTSYFVFGVVLRERLCPHNKVPESAPNNTDDLVIEELKYKYENVKLKVEHSCMEEKLVTINLQPIDVFAMDNADRVLQLRDLILDLSTLADDVMLEMSAEMKDLKSGIYHTASIGAGTDKNATNPMHDEKVEEKMHEIEGFEMNALKPVID